MKSVIKKNLFIIILTIIFFSVPVVITWDSAHYLSMTAIFEKVNLWKNWDIVRGISFPLLIYFSDLIFGKSNVGLTILMFIFYLIMLFYVYKIVNNIFDNKYPILKFILYFFVIINPIIFGYYHTLLTEFVAITFGIISCYYSWKWIQIYDIKDKNNIKISLIFIISLIFMWFIKQPYSSTVLFPYIISIILSLFKNHQIKNFITKLTTLFIALVVLFCSIIIWNNFLTNKGININTNRNSNNLLGNQIVQGIDHFKIEENKKEYKKENINKNKLLEKNEKQKLLSKENKLYKIISIYNFKNQIIDQTIIKANNTISSKEGIKLLIKNLYKHPLLILESYYSNYLALSNVYSIYSNDGVLYFVKRKFNLNFIYENKSILLKPYKDDTNLFYLNDELYSYAKFYENNISISNPLKLIVEFLMTIYTYIYKIIFILLPFGLILSIYYKIKQKKELNKLSKKAKNFKCCSNNLENKEKYFDLIIILLGYSFLHILAHAVLGCVIDRYTAPAFLTSIIGLLLIIFFIFIHIYEKSKINSKKNGGVNEKRRKSKNSSTNSLL